MLDLNLNFKAKLLKNFIKEKDIIEGFDISLNNYHVQLRNPLNYEKDSPNPNLFNLFNKEESERDIWTHETKGLRKNILFNLPFEKCLSISKTEKDVLKEVGIEDKKNFLYELVDEFDSSFEKLAVATLMYHIHYSAAACPDSVKEKYENLISKLSANKPSFTEEEVNHLSDCRARRKAEKANATSFKTLTSPERCEQCQNIYQNFDKKKDQFRKDKNQARHEFVDIMPSLWS